MGSTSYKLESAKIDDFFITNPHLTSVKLFVTTHLFLSQQVLTPKLVVLTFQTEAYRLFFFKDSLFFHLKPGVDGVNRILRLQGRVIPRPLIPS